MDEPRDRESWQQRAERRLPAEGEILLRNRAIAGAYAGWYAEHPGLHEWAGIAAFRARQTGQHLRQYLGRRRQLESWEARRSDAGLRRLDWFRRIENRVYRDTAWIYEAAEQVGFAGVASLLEDRSDRALLGEAVRYLQQAEPKSGDNGHGPSALRGNELLLRHVEEHTIQPLLRDADWRSALYLSRAASVDFGTKGVGGDSARSSFFGFMLTRGSRELLGSCSPPDFTRASHRWYWIHHGVLPLWRQQVAGGDPKLGARIQQMIDEAPEVEGDSYG